MAVFFVALAAALFWSASLALGSLLCGALKGTARLLLPVAGASLTIAILAVFHQFLPSAAGAAIVLVALSAVGVRRGRGLTRKEIGTWTALWLACLLVLVLPHLVFWGWKAVVPAYMVCNDSVIHAIFARSCAENAAVAKKIYLPWSLDACATAYPRGAHAVLWWFKALAGIRLPGLVHLGAAFLYSLTVFPVAFFMRALGKPSTRGFARQALAIVATASYFPVVIAYHGFLPQVAFTPFVTACVLGLAQMKDDDSAALMRTAAASVAGALLVYGLVGAAAVAVPLALSAAWLPPARWPRLAFTVALGSLASVPGLLEVIGPTVVSAIEWTPPAIWSMAPHPGNLPGFLSPFELVGIWFEPDYRLSDLHGLRGWLEQLGAALAIALALAFLSRRAARLRFVLRVAAPLVCTTLAVALATRGPYSTSKVMTPLAPLLAALVLAGFAVMPLRLPLRAGLTAAIAGLMLASTMVAVGRMNVLPEHVTRAMATLRDRIQGKMTLVYSDNDWLLYDVDSPLVDITDLFYRADVFDRSDLRFAPYQIVVFDGQRAERAEFQCRREEKIARFRICYRY